MDANEMTAAELRELAAKKEKEASERISHVGYLKMDLFDFDAPTGFDAPTDSYGNSRFRFWLKTKEQRDRLIKQFEEKFALVMDKGTKFVRYAECGSWWDTVNYGVENMSDEWAGIYLENIEEVK